MTLDHIAERLMGFDDRELGGGAKPDEIAAVEAGLGVKLEGTYREFLERFGWGGVDHLEFYGCGAGVPPHLDLVALTKSERSEMEPRLQQHLVPVMNDGGGNLYCLDTRYHGEPRVVLWDHTESAEQEPETEADSFAGWLAGQLDELE